ncbi:cell division ATP-binding protein FtsE [Yimella sp. cx-51]|uniref:cell division ATP-binding protein FtsE n=1 Tax=Yimella sp. cx-51 TaxID=2770551 RepID=UPI00165E42EB|nr:cell division ATP-binding protein FtsE [Yimella sp. cx-51]MBC9956106.1 cell division ATP-binding protein FtsE [Yimella sp. cx-51]QTH37364.1 cell division ATP-binding protein FtsE [Yimella sp. cx-51]
MITFENVSKRYAGQDEPALRDISVDVGRGDFAFLIGTSGSGKSTLLQLITRQLTPSSGTILVAGRDLRTLPNRHVPALRRDIGVVFQDFRLLENKNVYQNVAFALQVLGTKRHRIKQMVPEVLELVSLEGLARRRPHELSGGEQQRVAIARAMVKQPQILLADEPTGNLDPDTSTEIVKVLERINKAGTTVVVATHDERIVDLFRKRVIELRKGELVRDEQLGSYVSDEPVKRGRTVD